MKKLLGLTLLAALAGCGGRQQLQPAAGRTLPPKPAMALAIPTPLDLLTVPQQVQPGRSDELLTKSEERRDDRFSLPPP
jgi:hypothetical protein